MNDTAITTTGHTPRLPLPETIEQHVQNFATDIVSVAKRIALLEKEAAHAEAEGYRRHAIDQLTDDLMRILIASGLVE